ncbi:MFS transporter [Sphaerisporangium sp. NPDC051011]|uniref:MFS transporter n=1 Tax=Sphaerisporangium sp. NPDC051011 TaxID=3155792 RepID=UPI0033D3D16E
MSAAKPLLRLARAIVFATVCLIASAAGHAFAGGGHVDPAVLLAGAAGVCGLAYALNGRERGPEVMLGTSAAAQFLLHQMFAWTSHPLPTLLGQEHGHLSFGMTLAHLTVALVSGWWLYRGESAAWLLIRLWAAAPLPLLRWSLATADRNVFPGAPAVPPSVPRPHPAWETAPGIHRRGPPLPAIAG